LSALLVNEGMARWPAQYVSRRNLEPAPDPVIHAATVLTRLLTERGVAVVGPPVAGPAPTGATERAAITSPPLSSVVRAVNGWSNNTAAELVLKEIDHATGGTGSTAGGSAVVSATLTAAGAPVAGVRVNDGSGLDEGDRVTCTLLEDVLRRAGSPSDLSASLAVAGVDGTLRERFVGSPAQGLVRAKTGTLRSVTALSGYATSATEPGTDLLFSYVVNLSEAEGVVEQRLLDVQETLGAALVTYPEAPTIEELRPRDPRPVG
jgi:serine-type D-Ala-D-Ala carboxypeptidase/endopeptidase (penicillin-binding protein 4)